MASVTERIEQACEPVDRCPVCGDAGREPDVPHQRNRYSEEIAALLDVDEDALLQAIRSVRCTSCGLGYKEWWFRPEFYYRVFVDSAPRHPRGWDAVSGAFTPDRFRQQVDLLAEALDGGDPSLVNWRRRTVESYLDNIPAAQRREPDTAGVLERIEDVDLNRAGEADLALLEERVAPLIRAPKPYGRFVGFNTDEMAALVGRHLGDEGSYAEVACPLWGLLPRLAGTGVETWFLEDEDMAFWGPRCRDDDGRRCFEYAETVLGVDHRTTLTRMVEDGSRVDVLAVLNYLDHLRWPMELLRKGRAAADHLIVLVAPDVPGAPAVIQHFTTFNDRVFEHTAGALGMKVTEKRPCGDGTEPEFVTYVLSAV